MNRMMIKSKLELTIFLIFFISIFYFSACDAAKNGAGGGKTAAAQPDPSFRAKYIRVLGVVGNSHRILYGHGQVQLVNGILKVKKKP